MYTKKDTGYYVNRHSCFLLTYHVVLVTKYRKPVLQGKVKELVYGIIRDILAERGCTLKELNVEPDHVHLLFDAGPEVQVLDLVRVIKTKTSRFARKQYPEELKKTLLEEGILDGQLFCIHGRRYDQGYGGTVYPETGPESNVRICAAGIHPRSCGVSYGRGTLQNLIDCHLIFTR